MGRPSRLKLHAYMVRRLSPHFRDARMRLFETLFAPAPGTRIVDLGGATAIWNGVKTPLDITIVNLPGSSVHQGGPSHHRFTFVEGDATDLPDFANDSFDLVFSNSVIEHVGAAARQAAFARECRRLAPGYFVQTPSIRFPWEPHTGLPFWWFMPRPVKAMWHRHWARTVPAWNAMILGTTVIRRRAMARLYPDGTLTIERFAGMVKSYIVYRLPRQASPVQPTRRRRSR